MTATVGQAWVEIVPSARGFGQRLNAAVGKDVVTAGTKGGDDYSKGFGDRATKGLGGAAKGMFKPLIGAAVGLVAFDKAKDFIAGAVDEARESQVVGARTANVIKKMGASAWTSSQQIGNLATSLSNKVGIDDEAIQSGENLLLTFGNIRNEAGKGNDIFNQTTGLMVDMSAAMGQDMKSSAIQLGKALNDPVKGVTALSRVGVSFTQQQKDQIKTLVDSGKTMQAQKIILGEVKKEFGGAGAAMATPGQKAAVAWGNFKEAVGTALLPLIDKIMPLVTKALTWFTANLPGIIKKVQGFFSSFSKGGGDLSGLASQFRSIFGTIKGIVTDVVTIVVGVWQSGIGKQVIQYAKNGVKNLIQIIGGAFKVIKGILDVFIGLFSGDWARVWKGVKEILSGAWRVIGGIFKQSLNVLKLAWKIFAVAFKALVSSLWKGVKALTGKAWNGIKSALGSVWHGITGVVSKGANALVNGIAALPGKIIALGGKFLNAGSTLIGKFFAGLKAFGSIAGHVAANIWGAIIAPINSAINALNTAIPDQLKWHGIGIDLPDNPFPTIPGLATGGRATGASLAVIGEGSEPETVFPDSVLGGFLERMAAASGGGLPNRVRLVLADGTELDAYFEGIADDRIGAHRRLGDETRRAG